MGPSLTDANCHGIICAGNNICPYQHKAYVIDPILTKLLGPNFLGLNFCGPTLFWTKLLLNQIFFGTKIVFLPKSFTSCPQQKFFYQKCFDLDCFEQNFCLTKNVLDLTFLNKNNNNNNKTTTPIEINLVSFLLKMKL